jgi:hypothetical protein
MSNMKKLGMRGEMSVLLVPFILVVVLLIGAAGFGYWSYNKMGLYKNNADQLIAAATKVSDQQLTTKLDNQFAEEEKSPYKTYQGPSTWGNVNITYPKTYDAYVSVDSSGSSTPIDGYWYPGVVPNIADDQDGNGTNFALRVQVIQNDYNSVLSNFQSNITQGTITATPFHLKKVPSVIGMELSGQILTQKTGTLVILPLRNETLELWTEGNQFTNDFSNIVLPNFSFSP